MRAAGRRRAAESLAPDRRPLPPTPTNTADPWQSVTTPVNRRESDASFCSSLPSIASAGRPSAAATNISDRSYQLAALRTINSYLASHSAPFSLKPPLPSAKDITETLKLLLQRFGFASQKIDGDLSHALKSLKCPLKLNKSALRAPGTPHSWPNLLPVIHWLVQLAQYTDSTLNSSPELEGEKMLMHNVNSYLLYIMGDDEAMDALDSEFISELEEWRDKVGETATAVDENANELDAKLTSLKKGPSQKEVLEQEKAVVEKDVTKFHDMIAQLDAHLVDVQKKLVEKERALEAKAEERKRICDENEELKRKIEEQGINMRDAERMKRELQAVERNLEEAEAGRSGWEEKIWELDSEIGNKFKELEHLLMECNQTIRRLKLGNGFQYQLHADGSTPAEVLGLDYKSILKPALVAFVEEIKGSSMEKLEELISLRPQSGENAAKLEDKRTRIAVLQSHNDEVESQLDIVTKEMQEYISRRAAEAKKMVEEVETKAQHISIVEKDAAELLKNSKAGLHEDTIQTEEDVKLCARELFDLINSVAAYKEYVGSKIARMRTDLLETAGAVADTYKGYRSSHGHVVSDSNNCLT
ncbi:kinetochore protein NDC80 homolog [Salvia splendens]|uniref:kinetochore protein NDC80 homolog n=1 Tax=Salvia splendens TaxID=180675 RepID=UPI001C260915|nr:kinetochore protein NDC80 homolog [Salvia splendens]